MNRDEKEQRKQFTEQEKKDANYYTGTMVTIVQDARIFERTRITREQALERVPAKLEILSPDEQTRFEQGKYVYEVKGYRP